MLNATRKGNERKLTGKTHDALLTSAQMRAVEAAAIDNGTDTGLELMERAGRGVVEAVFAEWPDLAAGPQRVVVLCGPGNNGGDGFVVARLLKDWGWEVQAFLYGDPDKLPPDARVNYERWLGMGSVEDLENDGALSVVGNIAAHGPAPGFDLLIVDAVFGTGASRAATGQLATILDHVAHIAEYGRARVVAVDIPSGVCADSGRPLGDSAGAKLTASFHRAKVGHYCGAGAHLSGKLRVIDIGLDARLPIRSVRKIPVEQVRRVTTPGPIGKSHNIAAHKYSYGHVLVLSGGPGRGGAARLAARGALRIGAGVVTLGCPPAALQENAMRLDAVMLRSIADGAALTAMLEDDRLNAICLGPGLGTGDRAAALVGDALRASRTTVLDADALTLVAQTPGLFALLHKDCVLTPHAGEFKRLFPDIADKLAEEPTQGPAYSKVDATRDAAKRAGCTVLFKGPDTVIADADGRASINSAAYERAAPWLATAGAGDVLAGFISGLLARGFGPMQAAESAAWLHVECARKFGPGLIAEDLPETLPAVFRDLACDL